MIAFRSPVFSTGSIGQGGARKCQNPQRGVYVPTYLNIRQINVVSGISPVSLFQGNPTVNDGAKEKYETLWTSTI